MKTKPLVIFSICACVIVIVLLTKESQFSYVRSSDDSPLIIKDKPTSLLFIGDVMLGRHVEELMNQHGNEYPFTYVESLLADPDAVVANLEGPVMNPSVPTPSGSFHFSFPSTTPAILAEHHIGIVTLANNHTFDFGVQGYAQTTRFLDAAGVDHFGHPFAFGPAYVLQKEIAGQNFIFVGFNATDPHFNTQGALDFVASIPKNNEYIIVVVHGGTEYSLHSSAFQERLYRGFVDSGADLVIAHHPHVVEEVEQYKNKLIFYSLGNFIFDQYFSQDVQQMLAVKATITAQTITFNLIPLKSTLSQPVVMNDAEKTAWLDAFAKRSDPKLSTAIKSGELMVSR